MTRRSVQSLSLSLAAFLFVLPQAGVLAQDADSSTSAVSSSVPDAPSLSSVGSTSTGGGSGATNPFYTDAGAARRPFEIGVIVQSGVGLTEERSDFKFLMAGVHAGKVLTGNFGPGLLRGNFEYAAEVFPFWQSYTPKFQRYNCVLSPGGNTISCSQPFPTGGTYTGASITPVIFRWNFAGTRKVSYWAQAAGGLIWTNHKYPAFGSPIPSLGADGPNTDASVWNFTPQGGVGLHYFLKPRRSIDFGANGIHISSASLGDKNPGVNASVQFTVGYSWWK